PRVVVCRGTGRAADQRAGAGCPGDRGPPDDPRAARCSWSSGRDTTGGDRMTPTGTIEKRDGEHVLVQTPAFHAPIEDVWAAVTEPDRLARWIGTWTGDP